jgi:hypothetical protein
MVSVSEFDAVNSTRRAAHRRKRQPRQIQGDRWHHERECSTGF